ncbi:MAG: beta-lactamase family protein, partial [Chlamydiae bacterium]|nr:beta-lactamase family protein [Chlamydiota bacterium]
MAVPPVHPSLSISSSNTPEMQIQTILNRHFAAVPKGVPAGCKMVIMQEGKPGVELIGGNIPGIAPQHWGSVSKQFTAACILKLVNSGYMKFDDDIRTLCRDLPEFKFNGVLQEITVDHLLHMRSGLPEVWSLALMAAEDAEKLTNKQMLDLLAQHPGMIYPPGSEEMYCNTNYYLLAKIVEDVAKKNHLLREDQTFVDFVREQIFIPHDMQARCSTDKTSLAIIDGFDSKYNRCTTQTPGYGATGVVGLPSDMISWNAALASGEFRALFEPPKDVPDRPIYCRGLIIDDIDEFHRIRHGGALQGFVAIYRRYEHIDPKKTFAFFLATNYNDIPKAEKIADEVAEVLAGKKMESSEKIEES